MDGCIAFLAFLTVFLILFVIIIMYNLKKHSHDGELIISVTPEGKKVFSLELDKSPEELEKLDRLIFRIRK